MCIRDSTTPALAEIQYCYVNGRMMRDRLINHAIRQACEDKLGADQQPAFELYLEILKQVSSLRAPICGKSRKYYLFMKFSGD